MIGTSMMSPEKVAMEYGGNKQKIAAAVQAGVLDPTVAVMAGMFIDRMRAGAAEEQAGKTTVAQDTLAPQGLGATPQAQQLAQGQERAMAAVPSSAAGLAALPVDESMIPGEGYAGGGIVAFADGGNVVHAFDGLYIGGNKGPQFERAGQEEMETRRLREELRRKFAGIASPARMFTPVEPGYIGQFQENRKTIQGLLDTLPSLNKEQLQYLLENTPDITKQAGYSRASATAQGTAAPTTSGSSIADMMKTVPSEVALRSAPGLTPEQSASNIAASRASAAPAPAPSTREKEVEETVRPVKRTEIAPASFEEALGKAKTAMGSLSREDAFADIKAELADRKGRADEDLKQKAWMRLAETGFGMMAGTSPYAAVNIGKAAVQSIKDYGDDLKEQKKLDREDRKLLADIKRLEQADARENTFKTTELAYRILNEANEDVRSRIQADTSLEVARMQGEKTLQAARISASGRPTQYEQTVSDLLSGDPRRVEAARMVLGVGKTGTMTREDAIKTLANTRGDLFMKGKEADLEAALSNLMRLSSGASGVAPPAPGAVMQGYRFKGGNPADQKNWEKI